MTRLEEILNSMKERPDVFSIYSKTETKDGATTEEIRVERFTASEQPGKKEQPAGFVFAAGFEHPKQPELYDAGDKKL